MLRAQAPRVDRFPSLSLRVDGGGAWLGVTSAF